MGRVQVTIGDVESFPLVEGFKVGWRRAGRAVSSFTLKKARIVNGAPVPTERPVVGPSIGVFYDGERHWSGTVEANAWKAKTNKCFDVTCTSLEHILDRRNTGARVYHRHRFTADAGTDELTAEGHDFEDGYRVVVTAAGGAVLPGGLAENNHYYVVNRTPDTLQLSDSDGGPAIDLTDAGSGDDLFLWWASGSIAKDLLVDRAQGENLIYDDIQVGIPIEKRIYDHHSLYEAITELAAVSGYAAVSITEGYRVQFGPSTFQRAVFSIRQAEVFHATITQTREDFANVIHLKIPWASITPIEDALVTDGSAQVWDLSDLPVEIVSVFVNDEEATVGVEGVDTADFLWNPGERRFIQDPIATPLAGVDVLVVKFHELGGNVITEEDTASITERAAIEGNSGEYHVTLEIEDPITVDDATTKAQALLAARNQINTVIDATIKTQMLDSVVWARPGQLVQVQIPDFGVDDSDFLIDSVDAELNSPDHLTFRLRLLSGERFIDDIEYFRALLGGGGGRGISGAVGVTGGIDKWESIINDTTDPLEEGDDLTVHRPVDVLNGFRVQLTEWVATLVEAPASGAVSFEIFRSEDGGGSWGSIFVGTFTAGQKLVSGTTFAIPYLYRHEILRYDLNSTDGVAAILAVVLTGKKVAA